MDKDKKKLENQPWYHGLLPRSEIVNVLKEKGDWLVRCTVKGGEVKIVISVKWDDNYRHVMLKRVERGWEMPDGIYATVYDLIDSYRKNRTVLSQPGNVVLGKAISRAKWMIPKKDVKKQKKLGEGAFGKVYQGILRTKNRNIPVAIKTCKEMMSDKQRDEFMKEAKLMLNYLHRNVVRLYGVMADKPPLMLVMEFCPEGGLDTYLKKRQGTLSLETKIRFCTEAARGMEYLAVKKDCVHRDLATRNCLVGGTKEEVKVSDFGLSKTGTYRIADRTKATLPIRWSAPESLILGSFSKSSDVWSFGVLMWEIFAETELPWSELSNKEAYKAIKDRKKLEMPKGKIVPQEMENLMRECWKDRPSDRTDITTVRDELEKIAAVMKIPLPTDHTRQMQRSRTVSATQTEQSTDSEL